MALTIPKISLGSSKNAKNLFDLSYDNTTTSDWGFCQVLGCKELIPGSDLSVKHSSFVRLGVMNTPTFGRVDFKTYHRFVPIADLYPPFEQLLAAEPYFTQASSTIPSEVPSMFLSDFSKWFLFALDNVFTVWVSPEDRNQYVEATSTALSTALTAFGATFKYYGNHAISVNGDACTGQSDAPGSICDPISPNGSDYNIVFTYNSYDYIFAFRFNQSARNIRKVMIGLGYQLNIEDLSTVSVLPICAYYKTWFDYFMPQQKVTWTSTKCFKYLDQVRENSQFASAASSAYFFAQASSNLTDMLKEIANCYYTDDPDYVSAHVATPALGNSVTTVPVSANSGLSMSSVTSGVNEQPAVSTMSKNILDIVVRLTKYINKDTVIGGRLDKWLKVHLGADYLGDDRSYHIGANTVHCQISDVLSTAETDLENLGAYTGKGIGYDEGSPLKYHTNTYGFWICIGCVVPRSSYVQGLDPNLKHIGRWDYYQPEFDAVGFQITQKDCIFAAEDNSFAGATSAPGSFGFIPRYSEYKVSKGILNGMVSLKSTRASYLPYTLDKFISPNNLVAIPVDQSGVDMDDDDPEDSGFGYYKIKTAVHNIPIASTAWRYIGLYNWLGNFNRIFNNEGYEDASFETSRSHQYTAAEKLMYDPIDDNFIIHNVFDIKVNAPMLSMKDSFDTDGMDNNSMDVEKA